MTIKFNFFGTQYGGYSVPENILDSNSIVYSFGVGEDISFDLQLSEKYSCKIYLFDPTERSALFMAQHTANEQLVFSHYALWNRDELRQLYPPKDQSHVSYSVFNMQQTEPDGTVAECKTLKSIMRELNHTQIDLLKMDIEGAELLVLLYMIDNFILPKIICVEFHSNISKFEVERITALLHTCGYTSFVSDDIVTYVINKEIEKYQIQQQ